VGFFGGGGGGVWLFWLGVFIWFGAGYQWRGDCRTVRLREVGLMGISFGRNTLIASSFKGLPQGGIGRNQGETLNETREGNDLGKALNHHDWVIKGGT